ncbi:hypothetical protein J7I44_14245 [Frateuria sp. MAH-13]|uniref:Lysylphosphatidylglycerol synthetase n=1 Tax=Frateuria flava TaxID=2821489 RepID=A0ABS4DR10_9GAMM|nr:hypothetical protein [Frateuria flava]MBP1475471.1 hypothetical protein [Frateuria flava]
MALGCVGWILLRFVQTGVLKQLWNSPHLGSLVGSIGIAIPIYAAGLCSAGLAWCCLQTAFLADRPRLRPLFSAYAVTQFAKYLPGNVGHYVGRHLLMRNLGMSHRALLLATFAEAGLLVLASLVWAADAIGVLAPWLPFSVTTGEVALVECVCIGTAFIALQWWRRRNSRVEAWIPLHAPSWMLPVLPLQLLLFGAMALSLMAPAQVLLQDAADVWLLPAAAAASWVAGFVVIGAPGGLGVREVVFLALLHGHMPEKDILLLAAVFRIVTFGGDIVFMFLGVILRSRPI